MYGFSFHPAPVYPGPRSPLPFRTSFAPVWAVSYAQAIEMIKKAVQGEKNDERFYSDLIALAPDEEQQKIIASIREDERSHNRMFRDMYRSLTGQEVPPAPDEPYKKPTSYTEGLVDALFGELGAVERYRSIWSGLPQGVYQDTLLGIIMDEQKHATKYNYLYTLNQTAARMRAKASRL
ncbi:ferritin-like domain-containing protein [Gorillibacterium sp. CAU 1737]|uniref:ferritin-like domain-containing protein n=1 Tax=Gorillibacterium sp. CAU 1737 TaxID=3140362 RepID=UPI003261068B